MSWRKQVAWWSQVNVSSQLKLNPEISDGYIVSRQLPEQDPRNPFTLGPMFLYTAICEKDLSARSLEASSMLQSTDVYNVSTSINLKENLHVLYKMWFQEDARAFVKANLFLFS